MNTPTRSRKPASVNVDLVITGAVAGRGGVCFETTRDGVAERRVMRRVAEALHGGSVAYRSRGRTTLRAGWAYPATRGEFGAGFIAWTGDVPELPEDAADLAPVFDAAERVGIGEVTRLSVHVRPDGEPLPAEPAQAVT